MATNWQELTEVCRATMRGLASGDIIPGRYGGRYGGRYVARRPSSAARKDIFFYLDDDDPEKRIPDNWDILAQVTNLKVFAIGGARSYLQEDGSVVFPDDPRSTIDQRRDA